MKILLIALSLGSSLLLSCDKSPTNTDLIVLSTPALVSPADYAELESAFVTFNWNTVEHADTYELWVTNTVSSSTAPWIHYTGEENHYTVEDSLGNSVYHWKVRAGADTLWSTWSEDWFFTVHVEAPVEENIILIEGEEVELLSASESFLFLEGPAFDGDHTLYFSDIQNNKINSYDIDAEDFQLFRDNSNASNGLMFDASGRLIACEGGSGKVVAINASGAIVETLAATYNDASFNSPNDLVIDSDGGIYFTDPTWGDQPQGLNGVYYRDAEGIITRLVSDMDKPNGVIFNPEATRLYIDDSNSTMVRVYGIEGPGELSSAFETITLTSISGSNSGADGLAMDVNGNVYVTTIAGIQVFDEDLDYLLTIEVPETPANCTFGGDDFKTLYITARTNLYSIQLNNRGMTFPDDLLKGGK